MNINTLTKIHFIFILIIYWGEIGSSNGVLNNNTNASDHIHLATIDFEYVNSQLILCLWLLFAIVAKIVFHYFHKISNLIPESCLLILLGIPIGAIIRYGNTTDYLYFNSHLFFLILLPPIVLDAGYFINTSVFFENFWTIISFAVIGTLFNAIVVGVLLVACNSAHFLQLSWLEGLIFGALIAAVDPVAVLAVFDELQVNETLHMIVFGESLLNDAVTVVLYNLFKQLLTFQTVTVTDGLMGVALFLVVSLGGTVIGIFFGLLGAFVTRFTKHVSVIEPLWIILISYTSYLIAEMFHFSGILSIFFCGVILKYYVEINVSNQSRTAIKYLIKTLSSSSETYIFMQLGVSLFLFEMKWNTVFSILTLVFIFFIRCIGVVILSYLANCVTKTRKISFVEQFIMAYGGLRGAVSFSLSIILPTTVNNKEEFVATTIFIVLFTVFIQGISIKPIVKALKIKLNSNKGDSIFCEMNDSVLHKTVKGVHSIVGVIDYDIIRTALYKMDTVIFRRIILRKEYLNQCDQIILKNRDILYMQAENLVENNPTALFSTDKGNRGIASELTKSTLMNFKQNQYIAHEPILDFNIIDQIRKKDSAPEAPTIAYIVGKHPAKTTNKYTLSGIGEKDLNELLKVNKKSKSSKNKDENITQQAPVIRIEDTHTKPTQANTNLTPTIEDSKKSEDSQNDPRPGSLLRSPSRFRKSPNDIIDDTKIPTIQEVTSTTNIPHPDPGEVRIQIDEDKSKRRK